MYNELYAAWKRETLDSTLGALPPDFYTKIAAYLNRINQDNPQLDQKTVKIKLLEHEAINVKRMLEELLWTRYKKIIKAVTKSKKVPLELLTAQEAKMCESFVDFTFAYQKFAKELMQGQTSGIVSSSETQAEAAPSPISVRVVTRKRSTIRFMKNIPAIMGADLKSYGPFVAEDVASLPTQNAQVLVKQGLAVMVDAQN